MSSQLHLQNGNPPEISIKITTTFPRAKRSKTSHVNNTFKFNQVFNFQHVDLAKQKDGHDFKIIT